MPDTEVQTTDIGTVDFQSFKDAREKGLTAIPAAEEKSSKEETSDAAPKAAKPDSATETEQEENEQGKSKGKGGFQRKIDKLTTRIYELEGQLKAKTPDLAESAAVEVSDKPKPEDFKTYEEFVEALTDWKAEEKRAQWQAEESERQQQQALKDQFDSYNKRVEETKEKHEDFDEVVAESDLSIPQGVQLAIIEMDNGPEVAYYLAQHPEVCQKMLEMTPLKAIVEVARISDKLMPAEVRSKEKPVSKAPPPINPVGTRSTKSSVPLGEMSFQDYVKARAAGKQA